MCQGLSGTGLHINEIYIDTQSLLNSFLKAQNVTSVLSQLMILKSQSVVLVNSEKKKSIMGFVCRVL